MPTYKNPVTGQTVSVDESQSAPYTNLGWTATANVSNPTFTSITPQNLAPQTSINLNPQQPDTTPYNGIISGGLTAANAILQQNNQPPIASEKSDIQTMLDQLNPPVGASLYEGTYGVGPTQEEVSALERENILKQGNVTSAQNNLTQLNNQMQALNQEAKLVPLKIEQQFEGRGVTAGGAQPHTTAQLRDIALRALPLEAQIYQAQGDILIAQGDQATAQRLYDAAQKKFDKIFELRMADITNQYNYKKDQQDKLWEEQFRLTKAEQIKLDALQKEDARKQEEYKTNSNRAWDLQKTALDNGQADIAAKITALDPKSATFAADLAKLQGQIKVDKKLDTSIQEVGGRKILVNTQTGKTIADLGSSAKSDTELVYDMASKYSDAGILLTDTLAQAQAKLPKSRIYQDQVRGPVGTSSGVSSGVTPLTAVDFDNPDVIAKLPISDISKSIISGYGTTKDLTPTDRSKVISELYQVGYDPKKYILDKLDNLIVELEKVPSAMKGVIQGYVPANLEANASAFESAKIVLTRQLARLYDVGMLSDQDVADYKKAMPARTDWNINTSKAKVSGLKAAIGKVGTTQPSGILYSPDKKQQVNISDLTPAQIEEAKKAGWK